MNFREASKQHYASSDTVEHINAGSLQRIADATEVMARRYSEIITEMERYKRWYEDEKRRRESAQRSNQALRGQITKLRAKLRKAIEVDYVD